MLEGLNTLPCDGGILLCVLSDHLEKPEHHPLVMGCNTQSILG